MKPVLYLFINKGLEMSPGKIAAQASHAAVEAFRISKSEMVDAWYLGNHYTKLVLEARDAEHMTTIERYLNDRGFKTALIIDEGRTEIAPHSITALGVEIVDKSDEHTKETFGDFVSFKEKSYKQGLIDGHAQERYLAEGDYKLTWKERLTGYMPL